jgi:D-amino-acid dehydrogenase
MSGARRDVLILGGGAIGLACALFLLRAGRSVTVLEQGRIGRGSSHGNCGTITPSLLPLCAPGTIRKGLRWLLKPDAPLRIAPRLDPALLGWLLGFARRCNTADFRRIATIKTALLLASRARLEQLIREEQLDCEFAEGGTMSVYRDPAAFDKAAAEAELLRSLDVPVQILDGAAVRALEPALNDSIVGAHLHSGDARLRPDRYVAALAQAVRKGGGQIIEGVTVRGMQTMDGRISAVVGSQASYNAAEVICALGAWSPQVLAQIGLRLPIQPGKGYSITYTRPELAPRLPLTLKERSICVTAWPSGYRLGSTMEFAGYDSRLNRVRLDALARGAAEYLQQPVGPAVEEEWYGWRPMSVDELPIIGRAPRLANLTLATGHGMLGISLSAITGQLVSELLTGKAPALDVTPFAVERFG